MTTKFWSQQRQVNISSAGAQYHPDVAVLSNGEYVIAYHDSDPATDVVRFQRYNTFGDPIGSEVQVGTTATFVSHPSVTALPNGAFAVAWMSTDTTISLQKFNASGQTDGGVIAVASNSFASYEPPVKIVGLADGSIAAVYTKTVTADVVLKIVGTNGAVGGEILVDAAASLQGYAHLASNGTNIVVSWYDESVNSGDVQARLYSLSGTALGSEVTMNTNLSNTQAFAPLTALPGGNYVAVWMDYTNNSLRGQIFGTAINKIGSEFILALEIFGSDTVPIAATQNGGFFVACIGAGGVLYGINVDDMGGRIGPRIRIADNVSTSSSIALAAMPDGRIAATWTDALGLDGSGAGIFTRIFDPRGGVIDGTSAANGIYGHQSDGDQINGFGGNDTLYGLGGNDVVDGEAGNDLAIGGTGNDTLYGWFGTDTLVGEAGDDTAFGWDGDDQLAGHDGNDFLIGERGNDTVWGDAGNDRLGGSDGNDQLFGFADNDTLWGDAGDDTLEGGTGNDELYGFADNDRIDGQDGDDLLFGWFGNDTMLGGDGNDRMEGEDGDDRMFGWFGNDTLGGWGGADLVDGEEGNDLLFGGGDNDTIYGGGGNDDLVGEGGNDFMWGFFGDDSLQGGAGNDTLGGEAGLDRFFYFAGFGDDEIIGFEAGGGPDVIHLIGIGGLTNFGQVTAAMSIVGGNVVLNAGAGQSITFVGIGSVGAFAADDFVFG